MIYLLKATCFRHISFILLTVIIHSLIAPGLCLAQKSQRRDIRLSPGDAVHLYVYDGTTITERTRFISTFHDADFIIDGLGEIRLFSLGKVHVAGLTAEEIESLLCEKFKPFAKNPIVVAVPLIRISLRGAFKQPGMYRFSLNTSFWDMIREAGGLGDSNIKGMRLRRKDKDLTKDFSEAFYKASSLFELGIQSGDEIFAPPSRKITFRTITTITYTALQLLYIYFAIEYRRR